MAGLRILIGLLFTLSGFSKLLQPNEYFQAAINFYDILSPTGVAIAGNVIPWLEFIFGMFLALGYWVEVSGGVIAALTIMFQIVIGQALIRKLPIDECGCFGGGFIHLSLYQSFTLDTVIAICLIILATGYDHRFSLDRKLGRVGKP